MIRLDGTISTAHEVMRDYTSLRGLEGAYCAAAHCRNRDIAKLYAVRGELGDADYRDQPWHGALVIEPPLGVRPCVPRVVLRARSLLGLTQDLLAVVDKPHDPLYPRVDVLAHGSSPLGSGPAHQAAARLLMRLAQPLIDVGWPWPWSPNLNEWHLPFRGRIGQAFVAGQCTGNGLLWVVASHEQHGPASALMGLLEYLGKDRSTAFHTEESALLARDLADAFSTARAGVGSTDITLPLPAAYPGWFVTASLGQTYNQGAFWTTRLHCGDYSVPFFQHQAPVAPDAQRLGSGRTALDDAAAFLLYYCRAATADAEKGQPDAP